MITLLLYPIILLHHIILLELFNSQKAARLVDRNNRWRDRD